MDQKLPENFEQGSIVILVLVALIALTVGVVAVVFLGIIPNPLNQTPAHPVLPVEHPPAAQISVRLQAQYQNPFDKNAQYVNPFSQYKNPFDTLK